LATSTNPSFSEALSQFVAAKKNGKKTMEGHQEIGRFIAWFGRERTVGELTPAQVADYAHHVGLGGTDSVQKLSPVKVFLGFLKEEGWVETGLASHLRVPRSRKTASPQSARSAGAATQLSKEGFQALEEQLASLKGERGGVLEDIKRAMADKDFRENAPLEAAKERQGIIESRIRELEASLANAEILSAGSNKNRKRIGMGARVTLKDLSSGRRLNYTLVDMREANVASGKISTQSPVGQALLDRQVGEEISVNVPKGTVRYMVEKIGA
jgi:transcription elongation factor GreA